MPSRLEPLEDGRVRLGHIAGPHGVRGDVLIKSYTDVPQDIASYGPLHTQHGTTLKIIKCRSSSKGVVAFLEGVTSRSAAEALKGTELSVDRDQLPEPVDDDEWYVTDLVGLDVRDEVGAVIGTVVTVHDFGAGELIELRLPDRPQTLLAPFTKDIVPDVQVAEGFISVRLSPDLLGEDDLGETAPEGDMPDKSHTRDTPEGR